MNLDDDAIIAAAREGFLEEAQDNLRQFEAALLVMETDPGDGENLHAAFRAAHTIKGGAGLFGFDAVVAFTHEAETLLESLRAGRQPLTDEVVALLLRSADMIGRLLDELTGTPDPVLADEASALAASLRQAITGVAQAAGVAGAADMNPPVPAAGATDGPAPDRPWHLSLRFGPDALRNGLDPLAFIRYLAKLGRVGPVHTLADAVPPLDALDPEACHLGFEIDLHGDTTRAALDQVFEFVVDDADVALVAPDDDEAACDALRARRAGDDAALAALMERVLPRRGARQAPAAAAPADVVPEPPAASPTAPPPEAEPADASARPGRAPGRRGEDARFIRVRADKLDELVNLIGELVIAGSGALLVAQQEQSADGLEAALRIRDLVERARDGALGLRMVPIGDTFSRFQRVVRDVSKALGKEVDLEITGADTELDKSMVETIADPLMHLVRNSLDHGLETTEGRAEAGKPPRGRLALNAYHEAGQIVIEVSDDGRGVNRAKVLAKARERGLVEPDATPGDAEIDQLICAPGFSTADQVTDISGRGVGMDVVKRNVESLRGQMQIASVPGRGTTIQIRLPLTLAIIDGFLTQVGGVHYVVPLAHVVECIETPPACRARADAPSGVFDMRGEVMPYLDLRQAFGHAGERPARQSLLVVRSGRLKVGLLVDRLLGEHQTVIKPLGAVFRHLRGMAGSTILGSGDVALILDVPALLELASPPRITRAAVQGVNR